MLAALVTSGCSGGAGTAQAPHSSAAPSTSSSPPSRSAAPSSVAPTAADGTDYAACAGRSCEVQVSAPVKIRVGGSAPGRLAVTKVRADSVDIDLTLSDGGGGNGTLKPGCSTFVFHSSGGGSGTLGGSGSLGGSGTFASPGQGCGTEKPTAEPGAVTVQLPAIQDGKAILRIVTG
ncbi:hypothetical protein [Sciscionella sediminilitoris]|uniref:hypothetical protein n=1 Tax=Sciscionella sediminilitoris TaxID=1445613 RepID=UPI00068E87E9|nr:hypothetical protein [Sciscionella sp. SE31]